MCNNSETFLIILQNENFSSILLIVMLLLAFVVESDKIIPSIGNLFDNHYLATQNKYTGQQFSELDLGFYPRDAPCLRFLAAFNRHASLSQGFTRQVQKTWINLLTSESM